MSTAPEILRHHAAEVDEALTAALARLLPRIERLHPSVGWAADVVRDFVDGGKRIRPVLLLLGFGAAGGHAAHAVHGPALALELLHTCALVHDDVIDRADARRGRATVHRTAAAHHRDNGWTSDPDDYGEAVAILLGDLALVQADELFLEAQVPERVLLDAFRRFTVLREEVMVGQYLDLHAATSRTADRALATTVATLKSGRYSVARPLEIGALLAGADATLVDGLGAFGDPLGRAFQLRDDLLGVFGTEEDTGKSTSSDLAEGKRTLLIAEALGRLGPDGRRELEAGLGDPTLDAPRSERLRDLLVSSGARDAVEATIAEDVDLALSVLDGLPLAPDSAEGLRSVADYLGDRTS